MKISKFIILLLLLSGCFKSVTAQYDYPGEETEKGKNKKNIRTEDSKVFFGGNIGLSFWTDYAYIELSPLIGYKITPRFWAGGGPKYMYIKNSIYYQSSIYGIKNFASFAVLDKINEATNIGLGSISLYAENELLSIEPFYYNSPISYYTGERKWYDIVLAGFSLRFPLGDRLGFSIIVLWGLTDSANLLYSNPEVRLSVDF